MCTFKFILALPTTDNWFIAVVVVVAAVVVVCCCCLLHKHLFPFGVGAATGATTRQNYCRLPLTLALDFD